MPFFIFLYLVSIIYHEKTAIKLCEHAQLIQERTKAGLDAARARGRSGGRKKIASDNPKVLTAKRMHKNHGMSVDDICKTLKISRASFYRYIYPSEMKILDLVYRFFRPLPLKRFAIGLAITHLFRGNGQKIRIAQKPVSSLPMGISLG